MKKLSLTLAFIAIFCTMAMSLSAQTLSDYIDVVYLKNGSVIKGIIIEQVPGKSLKIETSDGSQYVYQITEVEKFTRELKPVSSSANSNNTNATKPVVKKEPKPFFNKTKGYWGGVEFLIAGSPGLRIVNGYKFGQFGYLGLAVGLEANRIVNNYYSYTMLPYYRGNREVAPFLTFNIVYAGDILKRRITPYYQVELGYGINLNRYSDQYYTGYDLQGNYYEYIYQEKNIGGPTGGAVFGVRFKTKKRVNFQLGLNARFFTNIYDPSNSFHTMDATFYNRGSGFDIRGAGGIRFGIGF